MLHYLNTSAPAPVLPSRRTFLKLSAGAAGGLLIGAVVPGRAVAQVQDGADALAMPFVHIMPDNSIVVIAKHLDKGQGTATGLATLVADELDAKIEQIRVEFAPSNPEVYKNLLFGVQGTGGSTAMANSFDQYRQAGATARSMLLKAVAAEWGVAPDAVSINGGVLSADGQTASFGDFAEAAAAQAIPETVTLKAPEDWVYIGKELPRVELPLKTKGSVGLFGIDVQPEDGLVAVIARPPQFGATVASVDASAARDTDGVLDVIEIPQGVAVVAKDTWSAMTGRDALQITWDSSAAETRSTDQIAEAFRALLDQPGTAAPARGDAAGKLAQAVQTITADYAFPYLNHAQMEPLNITALYDGEKAEFWFGSQIQTLDHGTAAAVLGLEMPNVAINTTWAGGSFGRRATADSHLVAEASEIAKGWLASQGQAQPIKLVYTREDDMQSGYYRPMHMHRVTAGLDADGNISGWQHRIVGQGIMIGTAFESFVVYDGIDHSSVEGTSDTAYDLPDFALDVHHPDVGIPVLWWRAVGHTHTAYVMETMMDELAEAAGRDPIEFRLAHLKTDPRKANVLQLAAEKAGWGGALPGGVSRGVAVHKSFNSYVAEIADVSLREDGTVKVEKVVCAVDCGVPINPDNIRAQIEGGLGYGLSGVMREEITLTDGQIDQFNYPDYAALRIADMPLVDVHIVASTENPTGVGEPGTPPIGPAVANAIYQATGQRVRDLPFARHGLA